MNLGQRKREMKGLQGSPFGLMVSNSELFHQHLPKESKVTSLGGARLGVSGRALTDHACMTWSS